MLSDDGSCKEAVASVLADRLNDGKPANSVNTGPYCKARQRLPLEPLKTAATNAGSVRQAKLVISCKVKVLAWNSKEGIHKA
jgi:hypothetical protein